MTGLYDALIAPHARNDAPFLNPDQGTLVDETGVRAHVADTLASFKHPKRYVMLDALPRNTMGKVQKNQLRVTYQDI